MISRRGFSLAATIEGATKPKGKEGEKALLCLLATEARAGELMKLFHVRGYISVEQLLPLLMKQKLPGARIEMIAVFIAGYLSAEAWGSEFDTGIYGDDVASSINKAKGEHAMGVLGSLLALMTEKGVLDLPDNGPLPPRRVAEDEVRPRHRRKKTGKKRTAVRKTR
jgi:hypothetical protein